MMAPHFEAAAAQLEPLMRLGKPETEAEPELGARFGIRSIPTLVLFQGGRAIVRESGALPAAALARCARGIGREPCRVSICPYDLSLVRHVLFTTNLAEYMCTLTSKLSLL